ncbi:hypothetical protein BDY24DRAFT_194277 [Mrakia frigida]|uniref:zinc finger MYND domain-containing protein n=1 Tax=Mrakia frigida TaxID=29902 RepID=UPI003FCC107E
MDTRYSPDGLIEAGRYADTFGFDEDDNWKQWAGRENVMRLHFMLELYEFRRTLDPISRSAISWKLASNKLVEIYNAYLLALDVMRETSKPFDAYLPYLAILYHCYDSSYVARLVRDQPAVAKDILLRIWKSMLTWKKSDYIDQGPAKRAIISQQIEIFSSLVLSFGDPFPFRLLLTQTASYRPFLTAIVNWDDKELRSDPQNHDKLWAHQSKIRLLNFLYGGAKMEALAVGCSWAVCAGGELGCTIQDPDQLSTCQKCASVRYCSRDHQREHWKKMHKKLCFE